MRAGVVVRIMRPCTVTVIERTLPGAGQLTPDELQAIARKSNEVLAGMAPRAQWIHSYVTDDKIICVYLAR